MAGKTLSRVRQLFRGDEEGSGGVRGDLSNGCSVFWESGYFALGDYLKTQKNYWVLWHLSGKCPKVLNLAPPSHWALLCRLACSGLSWFPISDYTLWFRTHDGTNQFLVKFWSIKKKEHFSSSKTDKVRAFLDKSLKFSIENLSKAKDKSLRLYKSYNDCL